MLISVKYIKNIVLFLFITIVYLYADGFYASERFAGIGANTQGQFTIAEYIRQFVFIIEYILAISILFICVQLKKRYAFALLFLLLIVFLVDLTFHFVTGKPLSLTDIGILNVALGETDEAIMEFMPAVKKAFLAAWFFIPLFILNIFHKKNISFLYFIPTFLSLTVIYAVILVKRGEPALLGFPKGFSYAFGSVGLKINDGMIKYYGTETLETKPVFFGEFKKIIVVIDESINYPEFAEVIAENSAHINYGKALSGGNCSAASNYIIRKAGWIRDGETESIALKQIESLYLLAKKAGYKTAYIDNQNVLNEANVKNYFDAKEIAAIDEPIKTGGENFLRDGKSLIAIENLLKEEKIFILTNKVGAHFPYESTLPLEMRTLNKLLNYKKSIELNARDYLNKMSQFVDDQTIIFYTSDHGQDLKGRTTHCNTGAETQSTEYSVPFVISTKNAPLHEKLSQSLHLFQGKMSHLEFSESVRNAIGFQVEGIDSVFKPPVTLDNGFCGLYGPPNTLFGIKPKCLNLK
jgi:hypothetical protein